MTCRPTAITHAMAPAAPWADYVRLHAPPGEERDALVARVREAAQEADPYTAVRVDAVGVSVMIFITADCSDCSEGGPIHHARRRRAMGDAYQVLQATMGSGA